MRIAQVVLSLFTFAWIAIAGEPQPETAYLTTGTQFEFAGAPKKRVPIFEILFDLQEKHYTQLAAARPDLPAIDLVTIKKNYLRFKSKILAELKVKLRESKVEDFDNIAQNKKGGVISYAGVYFMSALADEYKTPFASTEALIQALHERHFDCDIGALLAADILSELFPRTPLFLVRSNGHMSLGIPFVDLETRKTQKEKILAIESFETNPASDIGGYTTSPIQLVDDKVRGPLYASPNHPMITRIDQIDEELIRGQAYMQMAGYAVYEQSVKGLTDTGRTFVSEMVLQGHSWWPNDDVLIFLRVQLGQEQWSNFSKSSIQKRLYQQAIARTGGHSPLYLYLYAEMYGDKSAYGQAAKLQEAILKYEGRNHEQKTLEARNVLMNSSQMKKANKMSSP